MIPKKKKASVSTPAKKNIEHIKSYLQSSPESKEIFREFIGLLLLCLVTEQSEPSYWQVLDQLLHELYSGGTL